MGSYRKAIMTGFICRLCSEHKNVVIHVYSKRAKSMDLLDKITLLPITIQKYDKLPKTICESCIENLCRQYELVQQVRKSMKIQMKHRMFHSNGRCPVECPLYRCLTLHPPPPASPEMGEPSTAEQSLPSTSNSEPSASLDQLYSPVIYITDNVSSGAEPLTDS